MPGYWPSLWTLTPPPSIQKSPISSQLARTSLVNKYLLCGKRSLCEPLLLVKDTNIRKLNGLRQSSYLILNEDKTKCVAKINTLKIAFILDFFLRGNPQDFLERKFRTWPNDCRGLKQGCKILESEDILGRVVSSPVEKNDSTMTMLRNRCHAG